MIVLDVFIDVELSVPYLFQNWVIYAPAAFLGCGGRL